MFRTLANTTYWRPLVFGLLLLVLVSPLLGLPPFGGSSESREAHIIALMMQSGDYILPLRNGILPSKPPFFHWCGVVAASLAGTPSEFSARLVTFLSALATLCVTWRLAWEAARAAQLRESDQEIVRWGAVFVLVTTYGFNRIALYAMVDMTCVFWETLAIGALVLGIWRAPSPQSERSTGVTPGNMTLFFCATGFAVLSKGPLGIVLPVLLAGTSMLWVYGVSTSVRIFIRPRIGWAVFLLIALPWYIAATLKGTDQFLGRQIVFENIQRFTGGEFITEQPAYFYLPEFIRTCFPWSLFFLVFLGRAVMQRVTLGSNISQEFRAATVPFVIVVTGILFFSLAEGKRTSYLLPLYPWVSIAVSLGGMLWFRRTEDRLRGRCQWFCAASARSIPFVIAAVLFLSPLLFLPLPTGRPLFDLAREWLFEHRIPLQGSLIMIVAVGLLNEYRFSRTPIRKLPGLALISGAFFLLILQTGSLLKNSFKNARADALAISSTIGESPLRVIRHQRDEFFDITLYYLGREVRLVDPSQVESDCTGYVLSRARWFEQYAPLLRNAGFTITEVLRRNELDDQIRGRTDNEKVLFLCTAPVTELPALLTPVSNAG